METNFEKFIGNVVTKPVEKTPVKEDRVKTGSAECSFVDFGLEVKRARMLLRLFLKPYWKAEREVFDSRTQQSFCRKFFKIIHQVRWKGPWNGTKQGEAPELGFKKGSMTTISIPLEKCHSSL